MTSVFSMQGRVTVFPLPICHGNVQEQSGKGALPGGD